MVRICRAEDGEVFPTNATIHDIEGSESLEAFLRKETGIEEAAALAYLSDGRRLRTDNVSSLADVHDQTIFVFNKYYLDRDPDEVAKLLHLQPPLQPPIEQSQTATPPELGAAFRNAAQTHLQSISRIVDSMRYQRSALRLASSVVDSHVLNVSNAVSDVRQELEKRAGLVDGVDGAVDFASRVRVHREFMPPAVQRVVDTGGLPRTLGDYVSGERIRRAVEEFRGLQERLHHVEATVKQFADGAAEGRLICADARLLDATVALELSSQSLLGKIAGVTSALGSPVVNVEPILQELRSLDVSIRDNLSSVVESKNAYTTKCLRAFHQIHTLNAGLVSLPDDFTILQASLNTKGSFSDIERLHNMVYAYGATMVEAVRRKEFSSLFHRKCQGFSEVMSNLSAAETERRQTFRCEILGQLPFDLIGMDETLSSVEISVSGGEGTNGHYALEKHDIRDLLRDLKDTQLTPNDGEAAVKLQEVCTNLEALVGKIDALETGFTDLVERSLFEPPKRAASPGVSPKPASKEDANDVALPESVNIDEQGQTTDNDRDRIAQLERELSLARTQLASETATRRALEDQLSSVRAIVGLNKQGQSAARALADVDAAHEQPPHRETHVVQLLELAATYRQTSVKALALAQSQNNSEADEAPARGASPQAELDLDFSDPARAIEVLRSFDHAGYLQAITKTSSTIRKWQKQCKIYRERAKGKISFRDFAVGDLALFLPTRNSPLRPWAAFNVSFPHYFLQPPDHLNEQLQTREWVVARITSIVERVVDPNNPESNPYALGDGVRYYMLQVEDWTVRHGPSKRAQRPAVAVVAATDAEVPDE
ncbi:Autophagy-related protein 11 domain containing protein [Lactarius tabidus]